MTTHRFPEDIGQRQLPFVQFKAVKYKDKSFIVTDKEGDKLKSNDKTQIIPADSFYLPLPSDISNAYSLNWEMTGLKGAATLLEFFDNTKNGSGMGAVGNSLGDFAGILFDRSAQILTRQTPNPKKQALFNGVEPRTFTFQYTFSPHSIKEAKKIEDIIERFTNYSLPSLENNNSAFFQFPHEFEIRFHNVAGFPKLSQCVCTNVQTNYNPSAVGLLESGHALQTSLSLTFLETDLRRKESAGI